MSPSQPTRFGTFLACALLLASACHAQTSGNIAYGGQGGKARAEQMERNERVVAKDDLPPTKNSMFVEANVLMNVKADEYVAVFAISREGASIDEAKANMDSTLQAFTSALKTLHVRDSDVYVDFITEPKIYGYEINGNVAREKVTGFELKKTVSIHYVDRDFLDKLMVAAANAQIYDLVKVEYIVKDIPAMQERLMVEAAAIIKQKTASYRRLLGISVRPPATVYAERPAIYYPTQLYDGYTAAEAESLERQPNLSKLTVLRARKGSTFFFNGLDGSGFDKVINPVVAEPVVQFTLYLKLKYEVGP